MVKWFNMWFKIMYIMADFMGPFFKKYYILVLVDYGSGFTVLIPTENCGAIVTANAITTHWMPYFGWPEIFESDLGSAFKSKLIKLLFSSMIVKQKFAEPRYHQSIGKVERVIGFVQSILRSYNIEFDNKFVSRYDTKSNWNMIKSIIPLIQFSINRKRSRFTTISPAMLMLGEQIRNIPDISFAINDIKDGLNNNRFHKDVHLYLNRLVKNLSILRVRYITNWAKYVLISKREYDKRYNLLPKRDKQGKIIPHSHAFGYEPIDRFKRGIKVLYYVGPHKGYNGKWRQKWTGPWQIDSDSNQSHIVITDSKGKRRDVSADRLKIFKIKDKKFYEKWENYKKRMDMIIKNQPNLSDNDEDE